MEKKYELMETDYDGFYRIKALKDFTLITGEKVKKGDIGGFVRSEDCLSHDGLCWIKDDAYVFGKVSGNAVVKDYAYVFGTISRNAVIKDHGFVGQNVIVTENAVVQAYQQIIYGTVTTDLLGTKDWIGALYAELGVVPKDNKIILYKKVWKTDDESVFKSIQDPNFLYKIGETATAKYVDEDVFKSCTRGLHFTSLDFANRHKGNTILECEVEVPDIITVQGREVRARKCKVIGIYKGE